MLEVFDKFKGFLKQDQVHIDNNIFKLHCKATVIILMVFTLIVTAKQYVGELPIQCALSDKDSVRVEVVNTYCWIMSTFTLPKRNGRVGVDVAQSGVASALSDEETVTYHQYYQWVCFVLFLQAVLFSVPRRLWKMWEGGRMKHLSSELNAPIISVDSKETRKKLLVDYFITNLHHQDLYAMRFFLCEVLNFVNVVGQIYLMDMFLGGEFMGFGPEVLKLADKDLLDPSPIDPLSLVFPKVTKCAFHKYGPSGTIEMVDALCVLPLNVVNEKIYVFLWFWFMILLVCSGLNLIYRLGVVTIKHMRLYLLRSCARLVPFHEIVIINQWCSVGDWFLLCQLSKNIDPMIYKEVISDIAKKLESKSNTVATPLAV